MKPIRLELKEFGPYKHEIIEWNKIINEPMFLITGKTGAGKSTLFDAFVYALYNKTTGGKNIESLRTRTASDKDRTTVIFDFELKGKYYRIERTLAYKKAGNKNTTSGKVALIEIVDGSENVLATKEGEVKEKVEQIIGLDDKQFCQIIILPQGKFKEFLLSNSNEKKEVLRSLFDTYFYQKFVEKIQNHAKNLGDEFKQKERELVLKFEQFDFDSELSSFDFIKEENFAEVISLLKEQKDDITIEKDMLEGLKQVFAELKDEYSKLDKLNDKFLNLENSKAEFEKLSSNEGKINVLRKEVAKLEELEKYRDTLDVYENNKNKKKNLEVKKELLQKEDEKLKVEQEKNENLGKELEEKSAEILELRQELMNYNYFYQNIEIFKKADRDKNIYSKKLRDLESAQEELDFAEKSSANFDEILSEHQEENEVLSSIIGKIDLEILAKKEEVKALEEFKKLEQDVTNKNIELKNNKENLEEEKELEIALSKKVFELEKSKQQEILNSFLIHLHEGDDCPLCKQKITTLPKVEEVVTTNNNNVYERLEDVKKKVVRLETLVEKAEEELVILSKESKEREEKINLSATIELDYLIKELSEERKKQKHLANEIKETKILKEEAIEKIKKLKQQLISEQEYKEKEMAASLQLEHYSKKVPFEIAEFETYYISKEKIVKDFDEQEKTFAEQKNELLIKEKEILIELRNNKENLENIVKSLEDIEEKFASLKLATYYGNIELAKKDLQSLSNLEEFKTEIRLFEDSIKVVLEMIKKLERELKSKQRPDLESLKKEILQCENDVLAQNETVVVLTNKYQKNEELFLNLYQDFKKLEKEVTVVREVFALSDAVSGKTESKKSLETYVQGYYLDLILEAATKRLLKMTSGRYSFERKIEKSRGGGLQGLDIVINDIYLNSARDVNSLSGGELFLASLSLALGLAEVIQNESGGISLETIFIDEGFGTLDAETLDTAITTLVDLQSYGRNIGIISHVSELKERIVPKVEVYSENNYAKVKITGV